MRIPDIDIIHLDQETSPPQEPKDANAEGTYDPDWEGETEEFYDEDPSTKPYEDAFYEERPYEDASIEPASYEDGYDFQEGMPKDNEYYGKEDFFEEAPPKKGIKAFLNLHVLFAAIVLVCIVGIVISFKTWGIHVNPDHFDDTPQDYRDVLDQVLPLLDEDGSIINNPVDTIVCFGNSPFSDDRDSSDNLCNMIAKATDATVYNCSITGSYLAAQSPFYNPGEEPMDAYTLYWLVTLATRGPIEHYYPQAADELGDAVPKDAEEVYDMIRAIDFNEVDVITIMYDATDYLLGHEMYSDENSTDIEQFTGNLEASIELLQYTYPHIRIIVMSPTYAYALEEDGSYVSSDIKRYGQDVLSTYVIKERDSTVSHAVTFIDNLYGTVTEDDAEEYLKDHIHLNKKGRERVRDRFLYALNYYND